MVSVHGEPVEPSFDQLRINAQYLAFNRKPLWSPDERLVAGLMRLTVSFDAPCGQELHCRRPIHNCEANIYRNNRGRAGR